MTHLPRFTLVLACLATLTACVEPRLGLGVSVGANGVNVAPRISTGIPGVAVTVAP